MNANRSRTGAPRPAAWAAVAWVMAGGAGSALAGPRTDPFVVGGPDDTVGVGAAAVAGVYVFADSYEDSVEVRWPDGTLAAAVTRSQIVGLLPWMDLNGSEDGVGAVAVSDSGRLVFFTVHDANETSPPGTSDAVLRFDVDTGQLSVFARMSIASTDAPWPHEALAFFRGLLYVGAGSDLRVYRAGANDVEGVLLTNQVSLNGDKVRGLAVDRASGHLYMAQARRLYRANASAAPAWTEVGQWPAEPVGIAYGEGYGGPGDPGLYAVDTTLSPAVSRVWRVPPAQARGQQTFAPTLYLGLTTVAHDIAATADGALLIATDEDALVVRDTNDTRLDFGGWAAGEFSQVVAFERGLVTTGPDGPPGWVIDADVAAGGTRFHPASPDAAAWAVLLLLMNDRLTGDAQAEGEVAAILRRYAGRAGDGVRPLRSADGMYWHWIDPFTGGAKPGWGDGFATMSTMKVVLAAARARAYYPANGDIRASADAILCGVSNWDAYFDGAGRMALLGRAAGGADTSTWSSGFHEGILFTDQAAVYGGGRSRSTDALWKNRGIWPTATSVSGRPVSGQSWGGFLPAFVTVYPWLVIDEFRSDAGWRQNMANLRVSHAAWTDDQGPLLSTVFSAGTTAPQWGGYHADSLSDHPGNVTTLPALLALASGSDGAPRLPEAYGAYHAYRMGARQTFRGGASILYRRSDADRGYAPDSAGLPDVAMGALGLAELLSPGSVRAVLAGEYPSCAACLPDFNGDGFLDFFDYDDYVSCYETGACPEGRTADFNGDAFVDFFDYDAFVEAFEAGC